MVVADNKFVFSCFEKYFVLWVGKICWAIGFHLYSLNIRLQKDKFSRQHFKKISQTLPNSIFEKNDQNDMLLWTCSLNKLWKYQIFNQVTYIICERQNSKDFFSFYYLLHEH